jgi:hypothetical protein
MIIKSDSRTGNSLFCLPGMPQKAPEPLSALFGCWPHGGIPAEMRLFFDTAEKEMSQNYDINALLKIGVSALFLCNWIRNYCTYLPIKKVLTYLQESFMFLI